jgi:exosortase A-associated hydrolase 1
MSASGTERAIAFPCQGEILYGVLHAGDGSRGVVVVVGGPQYRVGSHRQFVLLARSLADNGVPVLRFDYRGMGDSEGESRGFEQVSEDIRAAVDWLVAASGVREVVLWGLCDAASAATFYAHTDSRITGLVLLNPWVRTEAGLARAYLRHYYLSRLLSRETWSRLLRGRLRVADSVRSVLAHVRQARSGPYRAKALDASLAPGAPDSGAALPERMWAGLRRFRGRVLVILSGRDLTAAEFRQLVARSARWRRLMGQARITRRELSPADHTFSSRAWRCELERWTLEWLRSW